MTLTEDEINQSVRLYHHKGKFLNKKYPQRVPPKKSAGIVCDFYNLPLRIDPSEIDMENLHGINKRIWDKEEDLNRITQFLIKYEPHYSYDLNSYYLNYDTDPESWLESRLLVICQECCNETDENGILKRPSWFETHFFKVFLRDYFMTHETIDNLMEEQVHFESLEWLETLYRELFVGKALLPESRSDDSNGLDYFRFTEPDTPNYYLDLVKFRTVSFYSDRLWGIRIENIGRAIVEGFTAILTEAVKVRRCKFPYCSKVFVMSNRGQGHKRKHCDKHRDDKYRKREKMRSYYEQLACYIAEWLEGEKLGYEYKAKDFDDEYNSECLEDYVRRKYNPDFCLTPHRVSVQFKPDQLNPYLEKHGFRCRREMKGKQYVYWFEMTE